MNIDQSDAETGQPGNALIVTSSPPSLMHSQYAEASAMVVTGENNRGEKDMEQSRQNVRNPTWQNTIWRSKG
jgi:hypothetical protein